MPNNTAIRLLAAIAAAIALSLGGQFFIPLVLGLILAAVLWPLVGLLRRVHVPAALGAALAVLVAIGALILAVALLAPPLKTLTAEIPQTLMSASHRLEALGIRLPGSGATPGGSAHQKPATPGAPPRDSTARTPTTTAAATSSRDTSAPPAARPSDSESSAPSGVAQVVTRVFGVTAATLFALVEVLLLAFFILAAGDSWRLKLERATQSAERHERFLNTTLEIRRVVLRYLLMNLIINAAQGVLVAVI